MSGDEDEVSRLAWGGEDLTGELARLLGPDTVGDGRADLEVRAPRVRLSDGGGKSSGNFAWWVADSGMKASMRLVKNGTPDLGHLAPERFGIAEVEGMDWFPGGVSIPMINSDIRSILLPDR